MKGGSGRLRRMNAGPFPDRTAYSVGTKDIQKRLWENHRRFCMLFLSTSLFSWMEKESFGLSRPSRGGEVRKRGNGWGLPHAVPREEERGGGGEGRWAAAALSLRFYRVPPPGRDLRGGAASGSLPFPIWMILDPMPGGACVAWACHAGESRLLFQEEPGGNRGFIPLLIFLPYLWPPHEASGCFAAETGQSHI